MLLLLFEPDESFAETQFCVFSFIFLCHLLGSFPPVSILILRLNPSFSELYSVWITKGDTDPHPMFYSESSVRLFLWSFQHGMFRQSLTKFVSSSPPPSSTYGTLFFSHLVVLTSVLGSPSFSFVLILFCGLLSSFLYLICVSSLIYLCFFLSSLTLFHLILTVCVNVPSGRLKPWV